MHQHLRKAGQWSLLSSSLWSIHALDTGLFLWIFIFTGNKTPFSIENLLGLWNASVWLFRFHPIRLEKNVAMASWRSHVEKFRGASTSTTTVREYDVFSLKKMFGNSFSFIISKVKLLISFLKTSKGLVGSCF